MARPLRTLAAVASVVVASSVATSCGRPPIAQPVTAPPVASASFDRAPWIADFASLEAAIERSYSHLDWQASPESAIDLPSLHRRTQRALEQAETPADAKAAILGFVDGFHDGHFSPIDALAPARGAPIVPPARATEPDAASACAALGYAPATRVAFSLPYESLDGFTLQSDGLARAFRSGVMVLPGHRLGIVRIPKFRAAEYPALCEAAWSQARASGAKTDAGAIQDRVELEWLRALADRLTRFRDERVDVVLVDIGGDGGGNDLGEWATRLFTARPIHSAPVLMPIGPLAEKYADEELASLDAALATHADLSAATRATITHEIEAFSAHKAAAKRPACDLSWVWREKRPRAPATCERLVDVGSMSGPLAYAAPGTFEPSVASVLYWATIVDPMRSAWTGPTYVLIDGKTGSAAEGFAALLHDAAGARTIGTRTLGLGCGSMTKVPPTVLPNSHLAFNIPNCVRLRGDGTDEVAGVSPDLPIAPTEGEDARARAARSLEAIAHDLAP